MKNSNINNSNEDQLIEELKSLEGNKYDSEMALFDAMSEIGMQLPKGYRSGSKNKKLTRKEIRRYMEYKKLQEVDPTYKKKRAVIITNIYNSPIPKEDNRGTKGRYTNYLKPLIVYTAMNVSFRGTKAELFDKWGVYDNYREEQIQAGLINPAIGYSFNPWAIDKTTPPGKAKYNQVISFKERDSLETALDSLSKKGIIEWSKYTRYAPLIKTTDLIDSIKRMKTWKEYVEDCDERMKMVTQLAEKENCVLKPELFQSLKVTKDIYEYWLQEYVASNGERLPDEKATAAQEEMYDNYEKFIRQLVVSGSSENSEYCLPDDIPNEYRVFTDWNLRRKYNELDKIWKEKLLGWEQVRKEIFFKLLDEAKAITYQEQYAPELAFELGCEYIKFMDEHMEKEEIYLPLDYIDDFRGVISKEALQKNGAQRMFPLSSSQSAYDLHNKMKKLFKLDCK